MVEINGAGHLRLDRVMQDDFRIIGIQLRGEFAIELSVLTLRAEPDEAMARIAAVLQSRGCPVEVRRSPNRPASH